MLLSVMYLGVVVMQASPASPAPAFDPGPAVGQPLPSFDAHDQDGKLRAFESLRGPNGLALVFFRSADW